MPYKTKKPGHSFIPQNWSMTYAQLVESGAQPDGTEFTVRQGTTYTYSTVLGDWILKDAYDIKGVGLALLGELAGDVTPANEIPPWSVDADGTTTTDGTWLKFGCTNETYVDLYGIVILAASRSFLIQGYFWIENFVDGGIWIMNFIPSDGGYTKAELNLYDNITDPIGLAIYGIGPPHPKISVARDTMRQIIFVEMLIDVGGNVDVYLNHKLSLTIPYADLGETIAATTDKEVYLSVYDTDLYCKDVKFFSLT